MQQLIGRTIKNVRPMTPREQEVWDWFRPATVIELDDGTILYPSRDDEGNDSGALFGTSPAGEHFSIH